MPIPRHTPAAMAVLFLVTPCAAVFAQTPTLGELAVKEQARRRELKTAARVITEQDLLPFVSAQMPVTASAQAEAVSPPAPPARDRSEKDEAWWRKTMNDARDEIRRSELFAAALQSRINALANDVAARDDPHQRAALADDRQRTIVELERLASDRERLKKKLADLEEEARRSGVPAGWLR